MVFSSLLFLFYFLPLTLILYYIAPKKYRNAVLFFMSLIFYAWGEPIYILLMLFSTLVDYTHGILIDKYRDNSVIKRLILLSSVVINLGLLGFFKYGDFVIGNINMIFGTSIPLMKLALPIGISFYTFQTMSYTIDVYRGEAPIQRNIISFGTYVTLFPQLIAGPIVRYIDIAKEIDNRKENILDFNIGIRRFIIGLGKKVLLANNMGLIWSNIQNTKLDNISVLTSWLGITCFAFQIYFDFSGYSDMAIGLCKMFGFNIVENFNYPYISKSISEFWRRWHISLGTWFREYVYIPLGGNRGKRFKMLRNLFIVWFLTGLWHGASWNFVMWGVYYGIIISIEKLFLERYLKKAPSIISHIYTMILVLIGWVLFSFDSLKMGLSYIKVMLGFGMNPLLNKEFIYLLITNGVLIIICSLFSTPFIKKTVYTLKEKLGKAYYPLSTAVYFIILFLSTAYLVDSTYNPFLYFRF